MHDRWKDEFEDAIESLSDSEKAELIERIARSMQPSANRQPRLTPGQVAARLREIASLPREGPDDGFSGRDHDDVLYGTPGCP